MKHSRRYLEIGLVLAIVVLANVAAQRLFVRCDLTEDERYTLSAASVAVLGNLDDSLAIKAFFSKNIPPSQTVLLNGVKDILSEYKAHGGAKVQIEFIDPYDDPENLQEMRLLGIPELTMTVFDKGNIEQRKVYMGLGIFYQDRKEVIQAINALDEFEYNVTSSIVKIAQSRPKSVGVWLGSQGFGKKDFWEDYQRYKMSGEVNALVTALRRQYQVTELSFDSPRPISDDVATILVIGPKKVSEADLYFLDQFVMKGGSILFLLDESKQDEGYRNALPAPNGLEPLLESYGVRVAPSIVADARLEFAPIQSQYGMASLVPYPFWPKVGGEGFDRSVPALGGVQSAVLPWTSPVETVPARMEGKKFTPLLRTSARAMAHALPAQLTGEQQGLLPPSEQEPLVLAGLLDGKLESFFKGKGIPAIAQAPLVGSKFLESTETGRVVVFGSSQFATDQLLGLLQRLPGRSQNLLLLQNLVDWLTLGEGLIGIRARVAPIYPLTNASEGKQGFVQGINLLAVPLLVAVYGVLRFLLRRRDRRVYEEAYRPARRAGASALESEGR